MPVVKVDMKEELIDEVVRKYRKGVSEAVLQAVEDALKKKGVRISEQEVMEALDRHFIQIAKEVREFLTDFVKRLSESASVNIEYSGEMKKKIEELEKKLNSDHFGLQKPKERIIDYFSAKELVELRGKEYKGAIICFVGPPGVGKTSLANSIAKSLKRELVRIALGGIEDVSELRGHRRTYVGSMPGRIVQGIINSKSMNPVIVLDEIDKIARHRGDPTSVLLEVLDPEQNTHFRDLYLNFELDLSQIIFIATANDISKVPAPLRDRLELIFVDSYTPNEKFEIAKKYLIPQELKKHTLTKLEAKISDSAIKKIIDEYTKEAGVRNLRKIIAKLMRKIAKELLLGENKVSITL